MQEEIDGLVNGTCSGNGGEVSRLSPCATLVAAEPSSAANPFGSASRETRQSFLGFCLPTQAQRTLLKAK